MKLHFVSFVVVNFLLAATCFGQSAAKEFVELLSRNDLKSAERVVNEQLELSSQSPEWRCFQLALGIKLGGESGKRHLKSSLDTLLANPSALTSSHWNSVVHALKTIQQGDSPFSDEQRDVFVNQALVQMRKTEGQHLNFQILATSVVEQLLRQGRSAQAQEFLVKLLDHESDQPDKFNLWLNGLNCLQADLLAPDFPTEVAVRVDLAEKRCLSLVDDIRQGKVADQDAALTGVVKFEASRLSYLLAHRHEDFTNERQAVEQRLQPLVNEKHNFEQFRKMMDRKLEEHARMKKLAGQSVVKELEQLEYVAGSPEWKVGMKPLVVFRWSPVFESSSEWLVTLSDWRAKFDADRYNILVLSEKLGYEWDAKSRRPQRSQRLGAELETAEKAMFSEWLASRSLKLPVAVLNQKSTLSEIPVGGIAIINPAGEITCAAPIKNFADWHRFQKSQLARLN